MKHAHAIEFDQTNLLAMLWICLFGHHTYQAWQCKEQLKDLCNQLIFVTKRILSRFGETRAVFQMCH